MWKEVKKRGAERLHWDVSYKVCKHLCQFHGKSIFKGLVTATNEYGEIRIQFNVVTDGQDQFRGVLEDFNNTISMYGHKQPYLVVTNYPVNDKQFFFEMIPSLKDSDDRMNSENGALDDNNSMVDVKDVKTVSSSEAITTTLHASNKSLLEESTNYVFIGLDTENNTYKNHHGRVIGSDKKPAICQLAYQIENKPVKCIIMQIYRLKHLPDAFLDFLREPRVTFVGTAVSGDLKNLATAYPACRTSIESILQSGRHINLGIYARKQNIVSNDSVGLQELVKLTLQQDLRKDSNI